MRKNFLHCGYIHIFFGNLRFSGLSRALLSSVFGPFTDSVGSSCVAYQGGGMGRYCLLAGTSKEKSTLRRDT